MTRKDYELIARAFRIGNGSISITHYDAETAIQLVAVVLADSFEKENPRFDRTRFLIASGVISKCDKCDKPARFITSRSSACSKEHAPEWVARVKA